MTLAELRLYLGEPAPILWDYRLCEAYGENPQRLSPENTGIPRETLDRFEVALDEYIARGEGILASRSESWIYRAIESGAYKAYEKLPRALPPKRSLPRQGEKFELRVCPSPDRVAPAIRIGCGLVPENEDELGLPLDDETSA